MRTTTDLDIGKLSAEHSAREDLWDSVGDTGDHQERALGRGSEVSHEHHQSTSSRSRLHREAPDEGRRTPRLVVRSSAERTTALSVDEAGASLGVDFVRAVDVALTGRFERMPEGFPLVHRGCRRALLRRFPYAIYFVPSAEAIYVIACTHVGRHPHSWRSRVGE